LHCGTIRFHVILELEAPQVLHCLKAAVLRLACNQSYSCGVQFVRRREDFGSKMARLNPGPDAASSGGDSNHTTNQSTPAITLTE
jgi:hypothetical protein